MRRKASSKAELRAELESLRTEGAGAKLRLEGLRAKHFEEEFVEEDEEEDLQCVVAAAGRGRREVEEENEKKEEEKRKEFNSSYDRFEADSDSGYLKGPGETFLTMSNVAAAGTAEDDRHREYLNYSSKYNYDKNGTDNRNGVGLGEGRGQRGEGEYGYGKDDDDDDDLSENAEELVVAPAVKTSHRS